ncbi:hypothetical protein BIY24_08285 [Halobacteriovorax marinus]|uniref:TolC family protein n=1 Tax=Halobacteriovorax marinus TaxID=97084 RepID=UPI000BC33B8C|nr:TolC family protein [Halobacteriovorax marinus]ATH07948.1 hypothetical protein BIY24_08285 [Halobacteriovorax marinus]
MYKYALILLFTLNAYGTSFNEALEMLSEHQSVKSMLSLSKSSYAKGDGQNSWGDPVLKIAAKNLPEDSLKRDQSPMSGIETSISQKIALTTKYSNMGDSIRAKAKAIEYSALDVGRELKVSLWNIVILERKLKEEREILKENFDWLNKIIKVTKKLYVNGKVSGQALLEIQIRKSEVEMKLSKVDYDLLKLTKSLEYLLGEGNGGIDAQTIPWKILKTTSEDDFDYKALALKEKLSAEKLALSASRKNFIPDVTISVGHTKRANIDGKGDFVSGAISFSIPISSKKYAYKREQSSLHQSALFEYRNYQDSKKRDSEQLEIEYKKIKKDLEILNSKTINFAKDSRAITSKSYGLGNSSYVELLQSELKLQELLMLKSDLLSKRDSIKVQLKYKRGEKLSE